MHADLVALSNVWQADAAIDRLKAEHEALTAAVASARAAVEVALARRDALAKDLADLKKSERATARELDDYVQKRDTTKRMIDTGAAPDYAAATRQLERCTALVDELETKDLELLERIDGLVADAARAAADLGKAETQREEAAAALAARDAPLRAELADVIVRRDAARAELPAELRAPYADLRRRKRPALVNVVDGACATCHMRVPPQRVVEVTLGRAIHTCPGCLGWILP